MSQGKNDSTVLAWSYGHALAMLLALLTAWWISRAEILSLVAVISFGLLAWRQPASTLRGYANAVTLLRLLIVLLVTCCYAYLPAVWVPALLITSLVMDGFDGYLARRFNQSSEFGHFLDVETDAFAILILSFLLWQWQELPVWVLLAGALRYSYVWIIRLSVQEQRSEPKRPYASVVAVSVFLVMTLRLSFDWMLFGIAVFDWALWIALTALFASFMRSALYQWVPPARPDA